jgi:hypothetical protein
MKATCKTFRAVSWEDVIQEAEAFIATLEQGQLIAVSHVSESPYGVVFVWYGQDAHGQSN